MSSIPSLSMIKRIIIIRGYVSQWGSASWDRGTEAPPWRQDASSEFLTRAAVHVLQPVAQSPIDCVREKLSGDKVDTGYSLNAVHANPALIQDIFTELPFESAGTGSRWKTSVPRTTIRYKAHRDWRKCGIRTACAYDAEFLKRLGPIISISKIKEQLSSCRRLPTKSFYMNVLN